MVAYESWESNKQKEVDPETEELDGSASPGTIAGAWQCSFVCFGRVAQRVPIRCCTAGSATATPVKSVSDVSLGTPVSVLDAISVPSTPFTERKVRYSLDTCSYSHWCTFCSLLNPSLLFMLSSSFRGNFELLLRAPCPRQPKPPWLPFQPLLAIPPRPLQCLSRCLLCRLHRRGWTMMAKSPSSSKDCLLPPFCENSTRSSRIPSFAICVSLGELNLDSHLLFHCCHLEIHLFLSSALSLLSALAYCPHPLVHSYLLQPRLHLVKGLRMPLHALSKVRTLTVQ